MITVKIFVLCIVTVVIFLLGIIIFISTLHSGKIKDEDKDFIPDDLEDKVNEIKEEVQERIEVVKLEIEDVAEDIGKAIDGLDDIPKAAAGAKRKGRPRKQKKNGD